MFFSFLNRFTSSKTLHHHDDTEAVNHFPAVARIMNGEYYSDFKLFHRDSTTHIDLLLFLPERGLYLGEVNTWSFDDLKGASVERSSRISKKPSATRFDSTESKIQQKLQDVLSFDSTVCERFMWMKNLREDEFDALDSSFHELLPKSRLIFRSDPMETVTQKLEALADLQPEPYSPLKVMGSLNSHSLLLPSQDTPFGAFLSDEQNRFLSKSVDDCITYLCGDYASGKSTVLIRKAMRILLNSPESQILVLTPTILSAEILRNEFVSLMEYGVLDIDLSRIAFVASKDSETIFENKTFQEATALLCDDAHLLPQDLLDLLIQRRGQRWLLVSLLSPPEQPGDMEVLLNAYRSNVIRSLVECTARTVLITLLLEIRKKLLEIPAGSIMVIFSDIQTAARYKPSIDEYFGVACRVLTPEFSLQYENLQDVLLATTETLCGISCRHLFLVTSDPSGDYTFALSRASETATIISCTKSDGEPDEQNNQK